MICEALSDRMPAVARGEASWDSEEAAHLGLCQDCQLEWRLVAPIARAARPAPTMDVERIAAAVHAAVQPMPAVVSIASRRRWSRALVGLAAAAGIALTVYLPTRPEPATDVAVVPTRAVTTIPELDALLEDELKLVLAAVQEEAPAPVLTPGPLPRLDDLTETELQQLLNTVEG
ncbi:MAG: hypothetical protein IPJ11_14455 [Gemmatimonadetes bacterium]|nr:hypothetical protein [Gemmatimonadota bacterium]